VQALDRYHRVTVIPFQKQGTPARYGLTLQQCEAAAWAITQNGKRYSGAAAANITLAVIFQSSLPILLYSIPIVQPLQDVLYAIISRIRSKLPGDTPYCEQHPEVCYEEKDVSDNIPAR
jgi:predicted DCC family thiol-disulfide oxidoreductase YuxK